VASDLAAIGPAGFLESGDSGFARDVSEAAHTETRTGLLLETEASPKCFWSSAQSQA
jgi:hypothetical protein